MSGFSQRLVQLRLDQGLTQEQLAQRLFVSRTALGQYERGEREPNLEILVRIAEYFNVSVDYLLGRTEYDLFFMLDRLENALSKEKMINIIDIINYALQKRSGRRLE